MRRTRVKICGVTRLEDAEVAALLGADAIGFVFAPSKRFIAPAEARRIARRLPPFVTTVGVFRDQAADHIRRVVDVSGVDRVQLHGAETPAFVEMLDLPAIKAIAVRGPADVARARRFAVPILFDAVEPGSGASIDLRAFDDQPLPRASAIAGGLSADNVGDVIARLAPGGVDVATGVESAPGIKDRARLDAFFRAVDQADRRAS